MTGLKVIGGGIIGTAIAFPVLAQVGSTAELSASQSSGLVDRAFDFMATGGTQAVMSVVIVALTVGLVRIVALYRRDALAGQAKIEKLLADTTTVMTEVKKAMEWCKERHKA